MKIYTQMNHEFIPRFPRTWERFLDHSRPEQALSLESVASFPILSASAFAFFAPLIEALCVLSAHSRESWTWLLHRSRSMANSDLKSQIHSLTFRERNMYLSGFTIHGQGMSRLNARNNKFSKYKIFDGIKFHMSKCIVIWSFSYIPKLLLVKKLPRAKSWFLRKVSNFNFH